MANLSGKTALVTGASVGIGRDLAEIFARGGHHLLITARDQAKLEEVAAKLRHDCKINVDVISADLSVPGAAQQIFDMAKARKIAIEFLVNNAGFGTYGNFADADLGQQLAMLQVNVVALTHLTRLFLPQMVERRSGKILNVGSLAGFVPGPLMAVYHATKSYVLNFSVALTEELKGTGVSVTDLCPGSTATEFQKRAGISANGSLGNHVMDSMAVARQGYDAMMSGRAVIVTGILNKLKAAAARLAPLEIGAWGARKHHSNRRTTNDHT